MKRYGFAVLVGLVAAVAFLAAAPIGLAAGLVAAVGSSVVLVMGDTTLVTDDAMESALKVIFSDSLINNVVQDSELLEFFKDGGGIKTDQTTGGRYIETAQLFNLPAGWGARAENGYIPVPRGPKIKNSRIELKKAMGSVEISGDTLKRVRTDIGAFVNWGEQVMPKLVERGTSAIDQALLGYGAGIRAQVAAVAAGPPATIEVENALGIAGMPSALLQFMGGDILRASVDAAGATLRAGPMYVEAIDWQNGVLQVDALATGILAGDYLAEGDAADNSIGKEAMGLFGIVDDGDVLTEFQNIDRGDFPQWRGNVIDAQAAPFAANQKLTEEVLVYADRVTYQQGGGKVDMLVTSRVGLEQLWKDLKGDRRINDPRGNYAGGLDGVSIMLGDRFVPVRVTRKMPDSVCFGLTRATLRKWFLREFEWDRTTGSLFRQVTDNTGRKDSFYTYGVMHHEYGSSDPQKNFRVENFDVS